ncbi:VOC family protein [Metabacillus idriensis]|uniref:VOC family protein n=1 Tax=Metabacillus idriensis TaxID=324768 RepID=UPI003D2A276A
MKFLHVKLECKHLEEMKTFYTVILKMRLIDEKKDRFTVKAGLSRLTFIKSENRSYYHICFRMNEAFFDIMFQEIESLLLPNEKGEVSLYWKGKQAYFHDPEGNVLEMLERKQEVPDHLLEWQDIVEVGMPCASVKHMRRDLAFLANQFESESDLFSFHGNGDGSIVVVKEGRHWYPTQRGSEIHPIVLEVADKAEFEYTHPVYPYKISAKKEC